MNEHDGEPVRGLPERLPPGEQLLWQGAPDWRLLARSALHIDAVAVWFALFAAARVVSATMRAEPFSATAAAVLWIALPGALAAALLGGFAWLIARTTVYTVTSRRLVIRLGIALPKAVDIPFAVIEQADLRRSDDGSGDIRLTLAPAERVSYLMLWPNVRAGRGRNGPVLRSLATVNEAAQVLGRALAAAAAQPAPVARIRTTREQEAPAAAVA